MRVCLDAGVVRPEVATAWPHQKSGRSIGPIDDIDGFGGAGPIQGGRVRSGKCTGRGWNGAIPGFRRCRSWHDQAYYGLDVPYVFAVLGFVCAKTRFEVGDGRHGGILRLERRRIARI